MVSETVLPDDESRGGVDDMLARAIGVLLYLFLATYFLANYGTRFLRVGVHNILLAVGLVLVTIYLGRMPLSQWPFRFWEGILLVGGVVTLFVATRMAGASLLLARAYLISFFCYVFVTVGLSVISWRSLLRAAAVYVILAGVLGTLQSYVGPQFYPARYISVSTEHLMFATGFSQISTTGAVLALWPLILVTGTWLLERPGGDHRRLDNTLYLLAIALGAWFVFLTFARSAYIGYAFALAGFIFYMGWQGRHAGRRMLVPLVILLASALGVAVLFSGKFQMLREYLPSSTKWYFFRGGIWGQIVDGGRRKTWSAAAAGIRDRPWWGWGKEGYQAHIAIYGLPPHNSYLAWMVYWGTASFLWVATLVLGTIQRAGRRWQDARVWITLMALLAVMIHAAYHDIIGDRIFWIALATASYATKYPLVERQR